MVTLQGGSRYSIVYDEDVDIESLPTGQSSPTVLIVPLATPKSMVRPIVYRISAMGMILTVKGKSEIANLLHEIPYTLKEVPSLPIVYNGNMIFELLPALGLSIKGIGLKDMDHANNGYSWATRLLTTSARTPRMDYSFRKVSCVGSIECRFDNCKAWVNGGKRNVFAWTGRPKVEKPYVVNHYILVGGVLYNHYNSRTFYVCERMSGRNVFHVFDTEDWRRS